MSSKKERAPRFNIEQAITLELTRERFIHAEGINLSETGLLMATEMDVEPLTNIYLMFTIPLSESDEHRIICEGSVARVEKKGKDFHVGVQFSTLEDEDRDQLKNYLKGLDAATG